MKQDFEIVDKNWLLKKLQDFNMKNFEVAEKIGVGIHIISKWLHDKKPIGAQSQAALYYFFRCLELEKELKK